MKILVVDDDKFNLMIAKDLLEDQLEHIGLWVAIEAERSQAFAQPGKKGDWGCHQGSLRLRRTPGHGEGCSTRSWTASFDRVGTPCLSAATRWSQPRRIGREQDAADSKIKRADLPVKYP